MIYNGIVKTAGLPTPPTGMHYMPNGDLMTGESHVEDESIPNYTRSLPVNNGLSDSASSSRVANPSIYSDIPLSLRLHPNLYDVRPLKDLSAIRQSVKNLILSNFTDRPFQPYLSSNVTGLLFEPADVGTAIAMKEEIRRVLTEYEPRVTNITIQIDDDIDANAYRVTIGYLVIIADTNDETTFSLERLK